MIDALYSKDVLRKAASISLTEPLAAPQARAKRVSPICGSRISVGINMSDGKISAYSQDIHACALGQASAAIVAEHVVGKTPQALARVAKALRAMLIEGATPPGGEWADYAILAPVHQHPARHGAVMLALEATLDAAAQIMPGAAGLDGALTKPAGEA